MSEVKRYDCRPYHSGYMEEWDCGEYVLHSDYAALEAERDQLRARVEELEKTLNWHEKHSCSVCLGEPLRSGKRCVCQGVGTASGEAQGFREEMHALRASIAALAEVWEETAQELRERANPDCASSFVCCATELRQLGEGNGHD